MNYRNRKLLDLAHKLNWCCFQLPGICQGYSVDGLEPAHSNEQKHGKGKGIKAHDFYHVAACPACHREYDSGTRFGRETKALLFRKGWERTMHRYFENGWLKVMK